MEVDLRMYNNIQAVFLPFMKVLSIFASLFLILVNLFIFSSSASAHVFGQPPFFKVNGKYVGFYPVPSTSLDSFALPQDITPENYLINQPIDFALDDNFLQATTQQIESTKFFWDFGDGTSGTGLKNTHTYKKIGSYVLTINAQATTDPAPQLLESVFFDILPNSDYKLPQAVIKVNGIESSNPLTDILKIDFSKTITLDASASITGSAPIVSYFWDSGDMNSTKEVKFSHKYNTNLTQIFPVLEVKDSNGFISDSYLQVNNNYGQPEVSPKLYSSTKKTANPIITNSPDLVTSSNIKLNDQLKRWLQGLLSNKGKGFSFQLLALILVFAVVAGSLHALTPGHGKSLMAAFLIGKNRSKISDAVIISLSITLAHTIVIYALGVAFLLVSIHYPLNSILPYFNELSAALVVILALSLFLKGYRNYQHQKDHELGHDHTHHHEHSHISTSDQSGQSKWSLFLIGASGGLVPCVDALSLLILSISLGQVILGLVIVFFFSVGLSLSIIILGLMLVTGKNKLNLENKLGTIAQVWGPIISGIFILILALRFFI